MQIDAGGRIISACSFHCGAKSQINDGIIYTASVCNIITKIFITLGGVKSCVNVEINDAT
jgi:hypothetical protein